jgi:hypothetical protein
MIQKYDSPSGYVTFYNYKEPFMKFKDGFGYEGVLLYDEVDGSVQCHLCGKWFESLGHHVNRAHNIKSSAYKLKVGLNQSSALISEKLREKLILAGRNSLAQRLANLSLPKKKKDKSAFPNNTRQKQNRTGNCPMQLLERIRDKAEEVGRTPTALELENVVSKKTIKMIFGTMANAIRLAGLSPRLRGSGVTYKTYTKEEILQIMINFKKVNKRDPLMSDSKRGLIPSWGAFVKHFGSFNNAKEEMKKYEGD